MCNRIVQKTTVIAPGGKTKRITVLIEGPAGLREESWEEVIFTGCATREKLRWWKGQGDLVTIPAEQYGEKNKHNGVQGFGIVPENMGIKAVVLRPEMGKTYRELKVVTCDGGGEAERLFGNNRVPLFAPLDTGKPPDLQPPLVAVEMPPPPQGELL